jgi:hypothetical protein
MLSRLLEHLRDIMDKKLYMGTFDHLFVKYGATLCGYTILGIPVFGANSAEYLAKMKADPSGITQDYIRNSSLLINMSKVRINSRSLKILGDWSFGHQLQRIAKCRRLYLSS